MTGRSGAARAESEALNCADCGQPVDTFGRNFTLRVKRSRLVRRGQATLLSSVVVHLNCPQPPPPA